MVRSFVSDKMAYPKRSNMHADVAKKIGSVGGPHNTSDERMYIYRTNTSADRYQPRGLPQHKVSHIPGMSASLSGFPDDTKRHLAQNIGTTRACVVCARQKLRTQGGGHIYSRYKCQMCDVVLCRGIRNCFRQYHQDLGIPIE